MLKGKFSTLKNFWIFNLDSGRSDSLTFRFFRASIFTFFYPIITALVVISLLDSCTGNDIFAVGAIRSIEEEYVSEHISDLALVTFDRNIWDDTKLPESREDIIRLAELLVENGANLVVLDYVFNYGKDTFPIPESLANKIIVGSNVTQIGTKVVEVIPPKNLFSDEILMGNWGDISLYDTEDRYGAINSLVYYYENNGAYLSLSLAAYNRALSGQSNQELKNNGKGIPIRLLKDSRYWLAVPSNISELDSRTYSAWTIEYDLMMEAADIQGKTVFVASTWDINKDHFYIGANSTDSFFKRILLWSGLSKSSNNDGKQPGVYAHINAYLNLMDRKTYKHTSTKDDRIFMVLIAYLTAIIIYVAYCALYRYGISRVVKYTQQPPIAFGLALVSALVAIWFTFIYSAIITSLFDISLSLTPLLTICVYAIVILTTWGLDNVKSKSN